ncbi:MAG TPA: hypothetical protein PLS67_12115 [Accumulibacter sp.]|nr:hypothetical protein [Accumulibacter sp.]
MPRALKISLIIVVAMACGHYTARFIFSAKIPMSFAKCFDEVKSASGKKRFKDEEEARAYTKTLLSAWTDEMPSLPRYSSTKNKPVASSLIPNRKIEIAR